MKSISRPDTKQDPVLKYFVLGVVCFLGLLFGYIYGCRDYLSPDGLARPLTQGTTFSSASVRLATLDTDEKT